MGPSDPGEKFLQRAKYPPSTIEREVSAMSSTIEEQRKVARLGLDPYLDWVKREGIHVVEGLGGHLPTCETKPWPRYGVNGAAVHLTGRGDFANCFALEIAPGQSPEP